MDIRKLQTADLILYPKLKENARHNRQNMTMAEQALWNQIRNKTLGVSFRRQHIIGAYIVDFICLAKQLIIEIDGEYHRTKEQMEYDLVRENYLKERGYTILRFNNEQVIGDIHSVTATISKVLNL